MDSVEIEYGLFECRKIGRRVLITYLAVTAEPVIPSKPCLPELTAFDCDLKMECGVCVEERQRVSCEWLFTTSSGKEKDAARLGATRVVRSREPGRLAQAANSLDLIIDTVSVPHQLDPLLETLYRDGTLVLVGLPPTPNPPHSAFSLVNRRRALAGSSIGGIPETQEMLDFCAAHRITAEVEVIAMNRINEAWERMLRSDVKYRFVIDSATLAA